MGGRSKIRIVIAPDGTTTMSVVGTPGNACTTLTRDYEKALGAVESRQYTGEYYRAPAVKREEHQTVAE